MSEPIVLESNQNHAMITSNGICPTLPASMGMGGGYVPMVLAIAEDGRGCVTVQNERAYTLCVGGGKPGQCYPCVLVVENDERASDIYREEILQMV